MNLQDFTKPQELERNSFLWSELRLIIAAVALFLGGVPPVFKLLGGVGFYSLIRTLLTLSWIISGLASGYLLYRWNQNKMMLFGGKDRMDTYAFLVSVVSGINLGVAGLIGNNIGMSIMMNKYVLIVVGLAYLAAAWQLWTRWKAKGGRLF